MAHELRKWAGLALILLAGVASALAGCAGASGVTLTSISTATATPITDATPCVASQLRLTATPGGAALGHTLTRFQFTNTSSAACSLKGFPSARLLDATGHALTLTLQQATTAYMWSSVLTQTVDLSPGASAYFAIQTDNVTTPGQACVTAATTTIYPPQSASGFTSPIKLTTCDGMVYISPVVASESDL